MNVAVIGVGLIGGSLARALRVVDDISVFGVVSPEEMNVPREYSDALDAVVPLEMVRDADVVFLCTPIRVAMAMLPDVCGIVRGRNTIVTDVCSTKERICAVADALDWGTAAFVGGHPMAGKETGGYAASSRFLLHNAPYVLTPTEKTPVRAVDVVGALLKRTLGARIHLLDPHAHDAIAAAISHVPHVLASTLVALVADIADAEPAATVLAAGGFRDMTRIASGDPMLWSDIIETNAHIAPLIERWIARMRTHDTTTLERAKAYRDALPSTHRTAPYACTVSATSELMHVLARHDVPFVTLTRGDGNVQLSFATQDDRARAMALLRSLGYDVAV
jgi:prephenate dehydrogenase